MFGYVDTQLSISDLNEVFCCLNLHKNVFQQQTKLCNILYYVCLLCGSVILVIIGLCSYCTLFYQQGPVSITVYARFREPVKKRVWKIPHLGGVRTGSFSTLFFLVDPSFFYGFPYCNILPLPITIMMMMRLWQYYKYFKSPAPHTQEHHYIPMTFSVNTSSILQHFSISNTKHQAAINLQ